jgi:hypothetical protein
MPGIMLKCTGKSSQQRIVWSQMAAVLRVRNHGLVKSTKATKTVHMPSPHKLSLEFPPRTTPKGHLDQKHSAILLLAKCGQDFIHGTVWIAMFSTA